ncbi:hypothetical protein B0T18DRAFT_169748 [Schizothecium vesticola]|uniref:HORMA domain-containing protein n=1 Tax=Schizothecium vesticola TaxID=314040 RepID=A0AA40ENW0_9PEZI|nr:hypothetical protein B0T18DRAFT_169748 [Schizothecium vesticola]
MASFPPGPQRKRDFEFCKVIFGAALSQILYARRSFAPSMFQVIPLNDLHRDPRFENTIATGSLVDRWDKELMRDQDNVLFLRQDANNYELNHFLGILTTDIFSLLEREQLVKFRVSFLSSPTLSEESLVEYYTFVIKYPPGGRYTIDIWRAGTGEHHISTTSVKLWNLGDYLSRLPPLIDPIYCTLAFHARERPEEPAIGMWGFDRAPFENANIRLQQRDGYSFQRIADLAINPLPLSAYNLVPNPAERKHEDERQEAGATNDATAEETLGDDRLPDKSDSEPEDTSPQEEVLSAVVPEEADPEEAALRQNVVKKVPFNAHVYGSNLPRGVSPPQLHATQPEETQAENPPPPRKATKAGAKKAPNLKPRAEPKPKPKPKPETKPKPKPKPKPKVNASKSRGQKDGKANTKGKGKSPPAKSPEDAADTVQPSGKNIATKRKPKTPLQLDPQPQLQIYEEVNSNMAETQPAARLSQLKSQNTQSGTHKRNGDDEVPTNSRVKRLRSSPQQFSLFSLIGSPRSKSPAINDPLTGVMSPDDTQSRSEEPVEAPLMPDLDDDSPAVEGLFGATLRSRGPIRPAKITAWQPPLFYYEVPSTSSEDENEDGDEDDEAVNDLGPRAMLVAPISSLDSCHGAGTGMDEVSGQRVVDAASLFPGIVSSDDEEE